MVNSMLRDSPLSDVERSNERLPEEGGEKLPEEKGVENRSEERGSEEPLEETPAGRLVMPLLQFPFSLGLLVFVTQFFLLDSQNPGNTVGRIEEAPHTEAAPVVEASASLVSPRSALPQEEKLKLVHKLLTVSSQIIRVLVCCFIE